MYTFGELLKQFRVRQGMKQQELADQLRVQRNTILAWEHSDYLPKTKEKILQLAEILSLNEKDTNTLLVAANYSVHYPPEEGEPLPLNRINEVNVKRMVVEHLEVGRTSTPFNSSLYHDLTSSLPPTDVESIQQRKTVVKEVYALLVQPHISSIVLTGIGGVGKSTLAALVFQYVVAQQGANTCPFVCEGFWLTINENTTFIDLAGTLFAAFGKSLPDLSMLSPHSQALSLVNLLNSTERLHLIVLDQFEHFLDAQTGQVLATRPGVGEWLDALNSHPCRSRILLTSRPRPRGVREYPQIALREYQVEGLLPDEGRELLQKQGVKGTGDELHTVVQRCDGHAYALVLFASLLRNYRMSLATLLKDSLLWTGDIATNLLDAIYTHQLNEDQRELLRAFSVYREAVPLEATQAIFPATTKARLLAALKALWTQHLFLTVREGKSQLHAIVREYVQQHFNEHDDHANMQQLQEAHARAAHYYQQQASYCPPQGKRQHMSDIAPLIEATWHLCQAKQWTEAYTLMEEENLFSDLGRWGRGTLLLELCQLLLPLNKWNPDPLQTIQFTLHLGRIYERLGRLREAQASYQDALERCRAIGYSAGRSAALNNLGGICLDLGKVEEALQYYEEALLFSRESGHRREESTRLGNLGEVYKLGGQKEKALGYLEEALRISRGAGDQEVEAMTLNNIGSVLDDLGRREEALTYYQQALQMSREMGDRKGESVALNNIGFASNQLGRREETLVYYQEALHIRKEIADRMGEGTLLNNLGKIYTDLGRTEEAYTCYEQALDISREIGHRAGEATALHNLGFLYQQREQYDLAQANLEEALRLRREIGDRGGEGITLNNLGGVYMELGDEGKAWTFYEQALEISREVGDRNGQGLALWNMSLFYFRQHLYHIGLACLVVAKEIFEEIHAPECEEVQQWIDGIRVLFGDEQFSLLMTWIEQTFEENKE
jgi:tetratricopeptide (TPR) repeat protein/transcriptional regulator with XRE-family HTH domain